LRNRIYEFLPNKTVVHFKKETAASGEQMIFQQSAGLACVCRQIRDEYGPPSVVEITTNGAKIGMRWLILLREMDKEALRFAHADTLVLQPEVVWGIQMYLQPGSWIRQDLMWWTVGRIFRNVKRIVLPIALEDEPKYEVAVWDCFRSCSFDWSLPAIEYE
jgi:hypothetical protein